LVTISAETGWARIGGLVRAEFPMLVGVVTTVIFYVAGNTFVSNFMSHAAVTSDLVLSVSFVWLFAVMVWCAFGVVKHAEALAHQLGEPYGTLILTISVISIEVTIMAIVMLTGEPNPALPRDTVMAVLMIVLNGMVGLSILVGAMRHVQQEYNLRGAVVFLAVISCLAVISLVMPTFTKSTPDETLTPLQAVVFASLTVLLYVGFLLIQTVRHHAFFLEPNETAIVAKHRPADDHAATHSIGHHTVLLLLTLLPIVLLSKPLAKLLNHGIEDLGAPIGLGGILIAVLVLSPEGLSAYQAATRNQLQRSVNLSLGSALSTIGLTIPTMVTISLVTGTPLELGLEPAMAVLLVLTLFISHLTFSGAPTNILLGLIHLVLFSTFIVLIFNP
jgi:Ca2+:H+ antiporter